MTNPYPDAIELANIHVSPDVYELENLAVDPDRRLECAMQAIAPWDGKDVLDLGSGTGFHIQRFHETAASVVAVEPHGPSHLLAMTRVTNLGLDRASVLRGSAEHNPLRDNSIDIVHARFAYFFGPGCERGLAELERVIRPGGTAFIIENDLRGGTFASWLHRIPGWSKVDPETWEDFFIAQGFTIERIPSEWAFARREDLEATIRLEFPPTLAEKIVTEHYGNRVDYNYLLIHRTYE